MFLNFEIPKKNLLKEAFLTLEGVDMSNFDITREETEQHVELAWGKYDYGVDKKYMEPDGYMLYQACNKFNETYKGKYIATRDSSDKFHYIYIDVVK